MCSHRIIDAKACCIIDAETGEPIEPEQALDELLATPPVGPDDLLGAHIAEPDRRRDG